MLQRATTTKVFGIGLSKTGTSSLSEALNLLGIPTVHFPCDAQTFRELTGGKYRLSVLDRFDGITDITVAPFYAQLDRAYPGSKFILSVREMDGWLRSAANHWEFMTAWRHQDCNFRAITDFLVSCVYGVLEFHPERFRYAYELHERNVREYFAGRPNDLLMIDICAGEGWEKLCPFLGRDCPATPFPIANRRQDRDASWNWVQQLEEAEAELERLAPMEAPLILVDDGCFGGSNIGNGRRRWPFTERDGVYWGPPADDAAANQELRKLRAQGARFIAFGWPAFWWLDHYRGFAFMLKSEYPCVLNNERWVVYDLGLSGAPISTPTSHEKTVVSHDVIHE